jgi:hypothetical protein
MRLINFISKKNRPLAPGLGVTTAGLRHSNRTIRDPQPPFSAGPGAGAGFRSIVREISDNLVIARAKGFNIGAIRKILAERRRDKGELEEERAVIELYKSFLGM